MCECLFGHKTTCIFVLACSIASGDGFSLLAVDEIKKQDSLVPPRQLLDFTKTLALSCQKDRKNKYKYACGLMTKQTLTHPR